MIFKKGQLVEVLSRGKVLHEGIFLGEDEMFVDSMKVGVLKTSIPGVFLKPGNKFISIFTCSSRKLRLKTLKGETK